MKNPKEIAVIVCDMYNRGIPICVISEQLGVAHSNVIYYLNKWYKQIYKCDYSKLHDKNLKKIETLYDKFTRIYKPFIYNRSEMCRMLGCKIFEFEQMLQYKNITYLRLKTYANQRTLCNIPLENYNEYKDFADKNSMSVRELACRAINEYILKNNIDLG